MIFNITDEKKLEFSQGKGPGSRYPSFNCWAVDPLPLSDKLQLVQKPQSCYWQKLGELVRALVNAVYYRDPRNEFWIGTAIDGTINTFIGIRSPEMLSIKIVVTPSC